MPSRLHEPLKTTDGSTVVNRSIRKIQKAAKAFLLFGQELQSCQKTGVRNRELTTCANAFQAMRVMILRAVELLVVPTELEKTPLFYVIFCFHFFLI